jgi:hypothetical protein
MEKKREIRDNEPKWHTVMPIIEVEYMICLPSVRRSNSTARNNMAPFVDVIFPLDSKKECWELGHLVFYSVGLAGLLTLVPETATQIQG